MLDHSGSHDWRHEEVWMYTSLETGHSGRGLSFSLWHHSWPLHQQQVREIMDWPRSQGSQEEHVIRDKRRKELCSHITDPYWHVITMTRLQRATQYRSSLSWYNASCYYLQYIENTARCQPVTIQMLHTLLSKPSLISSDLQHTFSHIYHIINILHLFLSLTLQWTPRSTC